MTIFYFTSTGNSLAAAKQIGQCDTVTRLLSVAQIVNNAELRYKDDIIGLILPVYGFSPPKIVRRFLKKVKWEAEYIFAIGTHGDRYAGFCQMLKKFCDRQNIRLDYVNTLKMVDNALIGYEMEAQIRTLPEKQVEEHLREIIIDIAARKKYIKPFETGQRMRGGIVRVLNPLMENGAIAVKMLSVDDQCMRCGTCAKVCPVKNIVVTDKVIFGKRCETCLGCVHHCPKAAIHFRGEKSTVRFRNPDVTLREIIAANEQKN
jgi:ferredoxin